MIPASLLFLNPIAAVVYAFILGSTILITYRRGRENAETVTVGRVALSFLFTMLTMSVSTVAFGLLLFGFLIRFNHLLDPGLGIAVLAVMLGPALCGLLSAIISLYLASRVSRLFWSRMFTVREAGPTMDQIDQ